MAKPTLDQGQDYVIFSSGCLDLSANILTLNMVFVRDVKKTLGNMIGPQRHAFFSLTLVSRSITHRHTVVVGITVKILKFGTPQTIAIIVPKIEKFDVTLH